MRWRILGMEAPETGVRNQESGVRSQVMVLFALPFLDITMRRVGIAKAVVKDFLKKFRSAKLCASAVQKAPNRRERRGSRGPGQFSRPDGMAMDSKGFLYVADASNQRVQKFTVAGP
jgi:hypothetical protein